MRNEIRNRRLAIPIAALAAATLSLATPASAENLLVNGGFDRPDSLAPWAYAEGVSFSWAYGGSARITTEDDPGGREVLFQCVPVTGASRYDLSASANVGEVPQGNAVLTIRARWYASTNCSTNVLRGSAALEFVPRPDGERRVASSVLVSPSGARSALVMVNVRADASAPLHLLVDDLVFAPNLAGETLVLPAAASAPGAHGQRFATDLWVRNPADVPRLFSLTLRSPGSGPNPEPVVLHLGPGETRFLPDVLADVFGASVRGRAGAVELSYDPVEGPLQAYARVAAANAENAGNGTATPLLPREQARTDAAYLGLAGLGGSAGFRVNAGVYNPNDTGADVTILLEDAAGLRVGEINRIWQAREWFQIDDLLAAAPAPVAAVTIVAARPVFPYLFAIDNRSGDATFVPPAPRHP